MRLRLMYAWCANRCSCQMHEWMTDKCVFVIFIIQGVATVFGEARVAERVVTVVEIVKRVWRSSNSRKLVQVG